MLVSSASVVFVAAGLSLTIVWEFLWRFAVVVAERSLVQAFVLAYPARATDHHACPHTTRSSFTLMDENENHECLAMPHLA